MKQERNPKSQATVKDIEDQNSLIIEVMGTMISKITTDLKDSQDTLYADTQKRLIKVENININEHKAFEDRLIILEDRDRAYLWVQKYGVKIFAIVCIFFSMLFLFNFKKP